MGADWFKRSRKRKTATRLSAGGDVTGRLDVHHPPIAAPRYSKLFHTQPQHIKNYKNYIIPVNMALITKFAPLSAVIPAIGGSVVATTAIYTWFRRTWPSAPTYSTEWNQASEDKLYHKVRYSIQVVPENLSLLLVLLA